MTFRNIFKHHPIEHRYNISDSIALVNADDWNVLVQDENIYLSHAYLRSLENSVEGLEYRYALIYNQELKPVMAAYFQVVDVDNLDEYYKKFLLQYANESVLDKILPSVGLQLIICGNLFICGENGYSFDESIDLEKANDLLAKAFDRVSKAITSKGKTSLMLIKELYPENDPSMNAFSEDKFHPFHIDCNMVLNLQEDWNSMEDYYGSMTSKFRTKANKIMRSSADLRIREFNASDIRAHAAIVDQLHQNVVDKADFSLGELNSLSFAALKENLLDAFSFMAYFYKDELIGFSVGLIGKGVLDAAHVGINYEFNTTKSLYQRMLHDFVRLAIERNITQVRFGRTAEQLKSTLGAIPVNMRLYIKHRNHMVNHLLGGLIEGIKPSRFELRKPFKEFQAN
ncbi:MAG: GNAT family N-acetyltransferase [Bacteroidia bacterium]